MAFGEQAFKHTARLTLAVFLFTLLYLPAAQAGWIATTEIVQEQTAAAQRAELQAALTRADVQMQLRDLGVNPAQVQLRVAALSDAEVQQLAGKIQQLPAGGDSLVGALVFVFIVLLITDILGLTDVFPFVTKTVEIDD